MTLYIFISHQKNLHNCYQRIKNMMGDNFIVVCGGNIIDEYDKDLRLLKLNCDDSYIGLPEKVIKTYHFLLSNSEFSKYTHFIKLDDDMVVNKFNDNFNYDYFGLVMNGQGNRRWHMNKTTNTFWDYIPYLGEFKPFCLGGYGYGVSKFFLKKVLPAHGYTSHIYEDVYIGILASEANILPTHINVQTYWSSPDHK